ncbi:hypothetical protein KAR91_31010 [Candidatus Pacearchaeota archaeon]|nr:hypothetical protein [Candidatus Pacearchaeota archaeon]
MLRIAETNRKVEDWQWLYTCHVCEAQSFDEDEMLEHMYNKHVGVTRVGVSHS